ncbi:lysozyme inhibitor LprI family protein [Klebsiella quasivariicola]|uniref:lysozyme inhibitor LprI family protein n=1 Tax=Klebsiella quasivariicola TaxID=2026240 RepID=UPI001CCF84B8|nr:lysozyme inhibitor LprI family protein [Klebsiella quasivariicola]MBZ9578970.1 DUF1311 domain-containing protein [Klebsiella quasivariicola]
MKRFINLVIVFSVLPLTAHSESLAEQENYKSIESNYKKSDQELNFLYKKQINEYIKEGGEFYGQNESRDIFLKRSQQAWIKTRDADCNYETYESRKGTGYSSIYLKCLLDKTNERIKYLKENN